MAALQTALVITKPDDWHHHLRDGAALATTVPFAARQQIFGVRELHLRAAFLFMSFCAVSSFLLRRAAHVGNRVKNGTLCTCRFGRAICMPNLVPPVTTTALALAYRNASSAPN